MPQRKAKLKKPRMWMARDQYKQNCYVLAVGPSCPLKPVKRGARRQPPTNELYWIRGANLCAADVEQQLAKADHLLPGQGPVEMVMTLKRKRVRKKGGA